MSKATYSIKSKSQHNCIFVHLYIFVILSYWIETVSGGYHCIALECRQKMWKHDSKGRKLPNEFNMWWRIQSIHNILQTHTHKYIWYNNSISRYFQETWLHIYLYMNWIFNFDRHASNTFWCVTCNAELWKTKILKHTIWYWTMAIFLWTDEQKLIIFRIKN